MKASRVIGYCFGTISAALLIYFCMEHYTLVIVFSFWFLIMAMWIELLDAIRSLKNDS